MIFQNFEEKQDIQVSQQFYYYSLSQAQNYLVQLQNCKQSNIIVQYLSNEPKVRRLLEYNLDQKSNIKELRKIPFEIASSIQSAPVSLTSITSAQLKKKRKSTTHCIESRIVMVPMADSGRILSQTDIQQQEYSEEKIIYFVEPLIIQNQQTDRRHHQTSNQIKEDDNLLFQFNIDQLTQYLDLGNKMIECLNKQLLNAAYQIKKFPEIFSMDLRQQQYLAKCFVNTLQPLLNYQNQQINQLQNRLKVINGDINDITEIKIQNDENSYHAQIKQNSNNSSLNHIIQEGTPKQRYFSQNNSNMMSDAIVELHPVTESNIQLYHDLKSFSYNPEALIKMHRRMLRITQRDRRVIPVKNVEHKAQSQPETTQKAQIFHKRLNQQLTQYLNEEDDTQKLNYNEQPIFKLPDRYEAIQISG